MTENTDEPNNISELELLAISEVKNIIQKYNNEYFKITTISLYYMRNGLKNEITFNQSDNVIENNDKSRKRTVNTLEIISCPEVECKEYKRRKKDHILKDSIITVSDHTKVKVNLVYLENNNFSKIFENCITEGTLHNYFRSGAFLNKILVDLKNELSEIQERSIVTGMLKGTGISNIFKDRYGNYEEGVQKKARRLYYASLRVYEVYSCFPNPISQIYCTTDKVSADALLKIGGGGKKQFNYFVNGIKTYVESNYTKYLYIDKTSHEKNIFDFNLITEDIKRKVKNFSKNPKLILDNN